MNLNGHLIAFETDMALLQADENMKGDVYLRDTSGGTTELISAAPDGAAANGRSYDPSVSADGRYIAFTSEATNLISGGIDDNQAPDVYVRDRLNNTTFRASVGIGQEADSGSFRPLISGDGGYVVFESDATNLVPCCTGVSGIYRYGIASGSVLRVAATDYDESAGLSSISHDGRDIAFVQRNLVFVAGGEYRIDYHLQVFDADKGSAKTAATASSADDSITIDFAAISGDGKFVAFDTNAALLPEDTNGVKDVYLYEMASGVTTRVSLAAGSRPSISDDGRIISYSSDASNVIAGEVSDIFAYDRLTGESIRVGTASTPGTTPVISGDGRVIAFDSPWPLTATDLDSNLRDVFTVTGW